MAQRLQDTHSPGLCVRFSKRHVRLCTQFPGTDFLSDPVKECIAVADLKIAAKKAAEEERDARFDLIGFNDTLLDNDIRTTASRCKEYDQNNPGSRTYEMIFPQNTSDIINLNPADEPAEVAKVIARIQSLGESHQLFPLASVLSQSSERVSKAVRNHLDGITLVGTAEAELQLAKTNLIRQYLSNMFEAEKKFGRRNADRLFPKITTRDSGSGSDDTAA